MNPKSPTDETFSEGSALPEGKEPDAAAGAMASPTDTVSLDALSMPDDQEQMQPPAVGDEVNYQVTGKVVSIQGNVVTVQKTAVNGQDVDGDNDSQSDAQDTGMQGLKDEADQMTQSGIGIS